MIGLEPGPGEPGAQRRLLSRLELSGYPAATGKPFVSRCASPHRHRVGLDATAGSPSARHASPHPLAEFDPAAMPTPDRRPHGGLCLREERPLPVPMRYEKEVPATCCLSVGFVSHEGSGQDRSIHRSRYTARCSTPCLNTRSRLCRCAHRPDSTGNQLACAIRSS